jgi:hypothetical protein
MKIKPTESLRLFCESLDFISRSEIIFLLADERGLL